MTSTEQIAFRKARDFSETLSETFNFIRQNIKPLVMHLLIIMGIPVLFESIVSAFIITGNSDIEQGAPGILETLIPLIPAYILLLILSVFYSCIVYAYIILYNEKGFDQFETGDVFSLALRHYLSAIVISMLSFIIIMVGLIVFVIPAIYLIPPLSLLLIIIFQENKSIFESFPRSFEIIRGKWWETFALIVLLGIVCYMLSFAISVPELVLGIFIEFNALQNQSLTSYRFLSAILGILTSFAQFIIFLIMHVGIAFQYFNLVEQKEVPGLLERIETIARSETSGGPDSETGRSGSAGLTEN